MHLAALFLIVVLLYAGCADGARSKKPPGPDEPSGGEGSSIEIALTPPPGSETKGRNLPLEVTFTNTGARPATVIRPQDGSFVGWLSPIYEVEVIAPGGNRLSLGPRCGNHGARYDGTSLVTVPAGQSRTVRIVTPYSLKEPGTYRVRLCYEVKPDRYPGTSYHAPSREETRFRAWPEDVYVGRVRSDPIEISVAE